MGATVAIAAGALATCLAGAFATESASMTLNEYLRQSGALTVAQLRIATGIKSDAQIRQWQHGYADRVPSPENCVAIEKATDGMVRRWDLRTDDWHRIWPELIGADGAPDVADAKIA